MDAHIPPPYRAEVHALPRRFSPAGGLSGRFGFGPATSQVRWELDRARAALARLPEHPGQVELVGAAAAKAAWPQLHDRVRQARVGEVSAYPGFWDHLAGAENQGH